MTNLDAKIGDFLRRMWQLAAEIEVSADDTAGAETRMQLEHVRLGTLLSRRASYNSRPDIDWSWMTKPTR